LYVWNFFLFCFERSLLVFENKKFHNFSFVWGSACFLFRAQARNGRNFWKMLIAFVVLVRLKLKWSLIQWIQFLNIFSQFKTPKLQKNENFCFFFLFGTSLDKKNVGFLGINSSVIGSSANNDHFLSVIDLPSQPENVPRSSVTFSDLIFKDFLQVNVLFIVNFQGFCSGKCLVHCLFQC
jgi:hypothetical protein